MVKKLGILTLSIGLVACSVEQIKLAELVLDKLAQNLNKNNDRTPTPTPTPTPTATPEPTETPREVKKVPCGKQKSEDGFKRGFTWKPNSDTQKWATVVLPEGTSGECTFAGLKARHKGEIGGENGTEKREVHILDGWTGQRLKEKHGAIIVRCECWFWSVKNPAIRVD